MRLYFVRLGAVLAALSAGCASAQIVGKSLTQSADRYDMAAITPIVQSILTEGKPGSFRFWSASGKAGRVHLVSGGGTGRCGRVRTTLVHGARESHGYVFNYCRDATGVWRTDG